MIDIREHCRQCTHHATCKFSEEYEKFNEMLTAKVSEWDGEYYTFIPKIVISCQYFSKIPVLARRDGSTYTSTNLDDMIKKATAEAAKKQVDSEIERYLNETGGKTN